MDIGEFDGRGERVLAGVIAFAMPPGARAWAGVRNIELPGGIRDRRTDCPRR